MAIDTKKLMSFLKSGTSIFPVVMSTPMPDDLQENEVDEIREELLDESTELSQTRRKLDPMVGYMEISEPAGGFSCGNCKWVTPEGTCLHMSVRAPVSLENGCCNLFDPATAHVVFPPSDEPEAAHESEPDSEEEPAQDGGDNGGGERGDDDSSMEG